MIISLSWWPSHKFLSAGERRRRSGFTAITTAKTTTLAPQLKQQQLLSCVDTARCHWFGHCLRNTQRWTICNVKELMILWGSPYRHHRTVPPPRQAGRHDHRVPARHPGHCWGHHGPSSAWQRALVESSRWFAVRRKPIAWVENATLSQYLARLFVGLLRSLTCSWNEF